MLIDVQADLNSPLTHKLQQTSTNYSELSETFHLIN